MRKRTTDYIKKAEDLKAYCEEKAACGSFAYALSASSMDSHIDELRQIDLQSNLAFRNEIIDFRFMSPLVEQGAMPLKMVSDISNHIRKMIGYAALRLSQGGIKRKRITNEIESALDLKLVGIHPGSSKLIVSSNADRDLFDDGVSKKALYRIFRVLSTGGSGTAFLEAITELGPPSARSLREFLELIKGLDIETEFTWRYSGSVVHRWKGDKNTIESLSGALAVTEIKEKDQITLSGTIELLSKREKIDLRTSSVDLVRILFPRSMLSEVERLHLNQRVTLICDVTETENPLTGESSLFYELKQIAGATG